MKKKDWNKIIHETYELLFKASEPSVDFNELLKNAIINERGEKVIPFNDYVIEEKVMDNIIKSTIKKYKMNTYEERAFSVNIYLGCSPKSKAK